MLLHGFPRSRSARSAPLSSALGFTENRGMPPDINALERATQVARLLSASLPAAVDPATVSTKAKIPFKALLLRELFLYRLAEISNAACELFHDGRMIGATILTRACLEAVAWLFVL